MTVYIYSRLSHEEQFNNGISLDTQLDRCKKYIELQIGTNDTVVAEQECISGGVEFRKRNIFNKIYSKLKKGDSIVVSRLDRLSRNTLDLLKLVEHLKKIKVHLHFVDLGEVSGEGIGRIFLIMLSAFAENERLMVSERIKQNKKRYKSENRYLGGYQQFGKTNVDGKYIDDEKEQQIIEAIVNLQQGGFTYRKISNEIKNKFGRNLHYSFVYKICKRTTADTIYSH
jgi:DNA invertase Pin-like site-specific DNA recombinase